MALKQSEVYSAITLKHNKTYTAKQLGFSFETCLVIMFKTEDYAMVPGRSPVLGQSK